MKYFRWCEGVSVLPMHAVISTANASDKAFHNMSVTFDVVGLDFAVLGGQLSLTFMIQD